MHRVFLLLGLSFAFLAPAAFAQEASFISSTIAHTYVIADEEAEVGDIISFDAESGTYRLAQNGERALVGVIALDPLIVLEIDPDGVPVVQSGEALVNVSTLNGSIEAGDPIAPSPIPGKGERARSGALAVGVAREAFLSSTTTINVEGREVALGTIRVQLSGVLRGGEEGVGSASLNALPGGPVPQAFKYIMALLIGVGSVYFSFRSFGANIKSGILSIGRNPLAKNTIQAMVVLNIILIVLVAGGGILLSIAILLLPF